VSPSICQFHPATEIHRNLFSKDFANRDDLNRERWVGRPKDGQPTRQVRPKTGRAYPHRIEKPSAPSQSFASTPVSSFQRVGTRLPWSLWIAPSSRMLIRAYWRRFFLDTPFLSRPVRRPNKFRISSFVPKRNTLSSGCPLMRSGARWGRRVAMADTRRNNMLCPSYSGHHSGESRCGACNGRH
jgi:hypothetical protein